VIAQAKKLGKSAYVFSVEEESKKVVHLNYVDPSLKAKGLDARTWANNAAAIVGGKVRSLILSFVFRSRVSQAGGKEDSAQGAGTEGDKVSEVVSASRDFIATLIKG
jgi:alanyl-tRNA synthetase